MLYIKRSQLAIEFAIFFLIAIVIAIQQAILYKIGLFATELVMYNFRFISLMVYFAEFC
jgi:hypothetical protein